MLVLARREGEELIIADKIKVRVLSVTGKIVRLGFDAPDGVRIERFETSEHYDFEDGNRTDRDKAETIRKRRAKGNKKGRRGGRKTT